MPKQYLTIIALITIVILALAPLHWPYGYYTVLRIVTTITFVGLVFDAHLRKKTPYLVIILGGIALLYNPLIPISLSKEIWTVINYATILVICIYYYYRCK